MTLEPTLRAHALDEDWPGLSAAPPPGLRGRIARALFERAVADLPVVVRYPDGSRRGAGGPDAACMELKRPEALFSRLGHDAKIGFGEAYMVGDWACGPGTDLAELLTPFAAKLAHLIPKPLQRLRRVVERIQPDHDDPSLAQARSNIHRHYDLSNELFCAFLDPTLTYSSAMFASGDTLEQAQARKIDSVLDLAGVGAGTSVLEIGTGWGELAIRAARRGATVRTLTLSSEQASLAAERVRAAGLADRVQIELNDYRRAQGSYDAVVSVEMIEAVGYRYWPDYFVALARLTAPGGRIGLQSITMAHDRMLATKDSYTWIHKYIFPGGIIPSIEAIEATVADHTDLVIGSRVDFGPDYATTLRHWRQRFLAAWPELVGERFDETFKKMWEFYLAYCEAGFRSGYLGVSQFMLSHQPGTAPRR
jgi:cyclopropane-fatty-acyl-phospholipid synthase